MNSDLKDWSFGICQEMLLKSNSSFSVLICVGHPRLNNSYTVFFCKWGAKKGPPKKTSAIESRFQFGYKYIIAIKIYLFFAHQHVIFVVVVRLAVLAVPVGLVVSGVQHVDYRIFSNKEKRNREREREKRKKQKIKVEQTKTERERTTCFC